MNKPATITKYADFYNAALIARVIHDRGLDQFDNRKLCGMLFEHGVEVLRNTADTITVLSVWCVRGKDFTAEEVIAANTPAVRAYLGY